MNNEHENSGSEDEKDTKPRTIFTQVTCESFLAWKKNFDAEMAELKKKDFMANAEINLRLSGRQYFEKNKNLKDLEIDEGEEDEEEGESETKTEEKN